MIQMILARKLVRAKMVAECGSLFPKKRGPPMGVPFNSGRGRTSSDSVIACAPAKKQRRSHIAQLAYEQGGLELQFAEESSL